MGSVSSTSSNLSLLLQTLSQDSQLSSLLSMPNMQSALEKASPQDLIQLSDQALQLQQVGLLFGNSDGTQSTGLNPFADSFLPGLSPSGSTTPPDLLMQALESSLGVVSGNSQPGNPLVNLLG